MMAPVSEPVFSRSLLRRAENTELPLGSLEAIAEIRRHLDRLEDQAVLSAREKGATVEDIASALSLTPQAIYYRLRNRGTQHRTWRGRPKAS
jgi:hypothetical protein